MKRLPIISGVNKPKFLLPTDKKPKPGLLARLFLRRAANFAPHLSGIYARSAGKNIGSKPKFSKPQQ